MPGTDERSGVNLKRVGVILERMAFGPITSVTSFSSFSAVCFDTPLRSLDLDRSSGGLATPRDPLGRLQTHEGFR